jgi:hypothetical protein
MAEHVPTAHLKGSEKTVVGDTTLFDVRGSKEQLNTLWEAEYMRTLDPKYRRDSKRYSRKLEGVESTRWWGDDPPVYLVPRERGGPSYLAVPLEYEGERVDSHSSPGIVAYLPVSKGYPMNELSSFSLGPVVGEGLCVVNAAFSKAVCTFHVEGGGRFDLKAKGYWRRARKPERDVQVVELSGTGKTTVSVDGVRYDAREWLRRNESLWLAEWECWRRAVAMCSLGSFHWCLDHTPIAYRAGGEYLGYVQWKLECYNKPAYDLLEVSPAYQYIVRLREKGWAVALVHPKAVTGQAEVPVTREYVRERYDSHFTHSCLPVVICGKLLGVPIYEEVAEE